MKRSRPLSPHLTVYKLVQFSSALSILHRLTGVLIFFGSAMVIWWFFAVVASGYNEQIIGFSNNMLFKALIFCISFAFFYHLSTGVRHLIWDTGCFVSKKGVFATSYVVIFLSISFTFLFWFKALY